MSRAQPMPPDERQDPSLEASRQVVARPGCHAAGTADSASEGQVARDTVYPHFDGKRTAFAEVGSAMMSEVAFPVQPIDSDTPSRSHVQDNLKGLIPAVAAQRGVRVLLTEASGVDSEGVQTLAASDSEAHPRSAKARTTGQALGMVEAGDVVVMARCPLGRNKEAVLPTPVHGDTLDPSGLVQTNSALLSRRLLR